MYIYMYMYIYIYIYIYIYVYIYIYIVSIYLTGEQVLICKHCYYFIHTKIVIVTIFFVDPRGL